MDHGLCYTPEYATWERIRIRCFDKNCRDYVNYGGRGITVCARWLRSPATFVKDMGPRPTPKHSLDRINNEGHYEPSNCRWATSTEQARNRRTSRYYTYNGETKTLPEWAEISGVQMHTIWFRIKRQWSIGEAIFTPVNGKRHQP